MTDTTPVPAPGSPAYYDALAEGYDDMFVNPSDLEEDEQVKELLRGYFGDTRPSCLDVGCGTGLLLDFGIVDPAQYVGLDPSRGMLSRLARKNPQANIFVGTAEEILPLLTEEEEKFQLVVALYASATYTTPVDWQRMVDLTEILTVFMTYEPGHLMEFYDNDDVRDEALRLMEERAALMENFADQQVLAGYSADRSKIGKFDVTVIRK